MNKVHLHDVLFELASLSCPVTQLADGSKAADSEQAIIAQFLLTTRKVQEWNTWHAKDRALLLPGLRDLKQFPDESGPLLALGVDKSINEEDQSFCLSEFQ